MGARRKCKFLVFFLIFVYFKSIGEKIRILFTNWGKICILFTNWGKNMHTSYQLGEKYGGGGLCGYCTGITVFRSIFELQILCSSVFDRMTQSCIYLFNYSLFHKTLPRSSIQMHSVRFYEMGDILYFQQTDEFNILK